MADEPDSSSGSPARVAFDLMQYVIRSNSDKSYDTTDDILDLFLECRRAVIFGKRAP